MRPPSEHRSHTFHSGRRRDHGLDCDGRGLYGKYWRGGLALTPAELVVVLVGAGDPSAPPKPAPVGPGARTKIGEPVFDHDDAEAMRRLADVLDRVDAPAPRSAPHA